MVLIRDTLLPPLRVATFLHFRTASRARVASQHSRTTPLYAA